MNVYTAARAPVALGDLVARGGEASVYRVRRRDAVVAKIYTHPRAETHAKLRRMQASPPADPTVAIGHASIAWPQTLVYDDRGQVAGYLMPFIRDAAPVVEVFNPRRRAVRMPGFSAAYLHRTARNLASALAALHARGYVVGDLNERNILVTPRALVTLIDCDSFQVEHREGGTIVTHPCPVGRLEYTPPELQGQAFRDIRRLPEHDAFGLAVLVFQLVMDGNHPFRSAWVGSDEPPSIEAKIARGWFPWADIGVPAVAPPPNAPDLDRLHPDLVEAFMAAFVDGHARPGSRPTAEEWANHLATAEAHLVVCRSGHVFGDHLRRCPACGQRRDRPAVADAAPAGRGGPAPGTRPAAGATSRRSVGGGGGWIGRTLGAVGLAPGPGARQGGPSPRAGHSPGAHPAPAAVQPAASTVPAAAVKASGAARGGSGIPAPPAALGPPTAWATAAGAAEPAGSRRQRAVWAAALAAGAATVAVGARSVLAGLVDPASGWIAGLAAAAGVPPIEVWAAGVGGLALAVVTLFRSAAHAPDWRLGQPLAAHVARRTGAGLCGWAGGWWAAAAAAAALGMSTAGADAARAAAAGLAPATPGSAAGVDAAGWVLGWCLYGAVAGALGEWLDDTPLGRAGTAAVFGAVGWLGARLAGALGGG